MSTLDDWLWPIEGLDDVLPDRDIDLPDALLADRSTPKNRTRFPLVLCHSALWCLTNRHVGAIIHSMV
ncbi:MAG: hypothetical protein JXB07_05120 [Anaerolineae bacterium]|nr:hypothetical protein [Anaerolineae bacterium]